MKAVMDARNRAGFLKSFSLFALLVLLVLAVAVLGSAWAGEAAQSMLPVAPPALRADDSITNLIADRVTVRLQRLDWGTD